MCDTMAAVAPATADGAVWFGKNSDREPGEAQLIEHLPRRSYAGNSTLRCTYIEVPQASETSEVILSRPFWMWGAEMGVNEHGLAIGNEAVFTRIAVAKTGLTGMDLLRLALERAVTAQQAIGLITKLLAEHEQGGGCGYRHRNFRYHNSFIIADTAEAWVLETAGRYWAAQRVRGIKTISNVLSIGRDFDMISDDAYSYAKQQGWCRSTADFDFARCFGDTSRRLVTGGLDRSACTLQRLKRSEGRITRSDLFDALRDHAGLSPREGWRMKMPCAHASWWPARLCGQTTGSMVSRLKDNGSMSWLTGTSSPCLSVFKPARLGGELLDTGPQPSAGFDAASLFWRHEQLHRLVLGDYSRRKSLFKSEQMKLESEFVSRVEMSAIQKCWDEHRQVIPEWLARVKNVAKPRRSLSLFDRYWATQSGLDRFPSSEASTLLTGG